jgi:hypothetical protein
MRYEVAEVEIYVYRACGASGPRSHDPDISRISNTDSSFGDGWGVNVQHHNEATAAALGRHVMFCSDAHLAEDRDVELYATAQAICAFAAGRIMHSPKQLSADSRQVRHPRAGSSPGRARAGVAMLITAADLVSASMSFPGRPQCPVPGWSHLCGTWPL